MQVVTNAGIPWSVVRVWDNADRSFERRLKNGKNARRLCPVCNPDHWQDNERTDT